MDMILQKLKDGIALYLGVVSALIIPLYIQDGYLTLIETKAGLYLRLVSPALFAGGFLFFLFALLHFSTFIKKNNKCAGELCRDQKACSRRHAVSALLCAIGVWPLFSSLLSPDPVSSFYGTIGWSMGSLFLCVLTFSTLYIKACFPFPVKEDVNARPFGRSLRTVLLPGAFCVVNAVIFLFSAVQEAGFDPFGFLSQLDEPYVFAYFSTIGQKNCFSGYLCLVLPLFWGMFISARDRFSARVCGAVSALGFLCSAAADSDSLYAGFGLCAMFMLPYLLAEQERTRRAGILLILYGISLSAVGQLPCFSERVLCMGSISRAMTGLPCALAVLAAGIILILFSKTEYPAQKINTGRPAGNLKTGHPKGNLKTGHPKGNLKTGCPAGNPKTGHPAGKVLWVLEGIFILSIAAAIVYTAVHFDDSWGTNRGAIWRVGWEWFQRCDARRKLFGNGPELLAVVFAELRMTMHMNVGTAHCEPLHVLLSQGLVGLVLYLTFWGFVLYLFLKKKLWLEGRAVLFFPLAAYFGQSLFSSTYPVTAAVFSVAAGLYLKIAEE